MHGQGRARASNRSPSNPTKAQATEPKPGQSATKEKQIAKRGQGPSNQTRPRPQRRQGKRISNRGPSNQPSPGPSNPAKPQPNQCQTGGSIGFGMGTSDQRDEAAIVIQRENKVRMRKSMRSAEVRQENATVRKQRCANRSATKTMCGSQGANKQRNV